MTGEPSPLADDAAYFGRTEISETAAGLDVSDFANFTDALSIEELTSRCANFCGVQGFFARREQELVEALSWGYALHVQLRNDIDAIERLRRHPLLQHRARAPSKNNVAHLAMLLVGRPNDQRQRKICSDYASVLIWASDQNVLPCDFAKAWRATTLSECKAYVRDQRRAAKTISRVAKDECDPRLVIQLVKDSTSSALFNLPINSDEYDLLLQAKPEIRIGPFNKRLAVFYLILQRIQSTVGDYLTAPDSS